MNKTMNKTKNKTQNYNEIKKNTKDSKATIQKNINIKKYFS